MRLPSPASGKDLPATRASGPPPPSPGIQPHGFLLVLDRARGTILQASASVRQHLHATPAVLLGQKLSQLVRPAGSRFHERLRAATQAERTPHHLGTVAFVAVDGRFDLVVHRYGGSIVAEFEPAAPPARPSDLGDFVDRAHQCVTADELCELAVERIRRMTGFGRVIAYALDPDGHGRVNAERRGRGYVSLLGRHFPAAEQPPETDRGDRAQRLSYIPDTGSKPSPLEPARNPDTGACTDLSLAGLRAAPPAMLHCLEDVGARAAMSLPLMSQGRLWGMIACHHAQPRAMPQAVRAQCDLLVQVVALQIGARQAQAEADRRHELQRLMGLLLAAMSRHDSVPAGLASVPAPLLAFADAGGAAIVHGDDCLTFGRTPGHRAVQALAARLARAGDTALFHTACLPEAVPEFASLRDVACGVLALPISELHANYVLWFRPEWARGRARPWEPCELESAAELRTAITGVVLRKAEELAGLADELGRTNQELEAFSYSVSHDLRAPLRHIAGYADLLREYEGAHLSDRGARYLDNIGDSARFAGRLVDALLTFSQMGRSALRPSQVDLAQVLEQIRRELAPDLDGRQVEWIMGDLPSVHADAAYMHLALRNLLSNAIKYTRGRAPAVIEISAEPRHGGHIIHVRDNGVGFDMKYVGKLFGVFQRLHRMEEFEGTGIGLANVRRIVERHGGRVWAEGSPGHGATFYLFLPDAQPPAATAADMKE